VLQRYNNLGNLTNTYTFAGIYALGGGGLTVSGNVVHYDGADGELYRGVINTATNTVTFSKATTTAPFGTTGTIPYDFASCSNEGFCLNKGALDSVVACADTARINLTATGPGPYNWTVLSGPATITGNGKTVLVTASGPSVITYRDADCAGANTITDTTVIFVTSAKVDAGPDHTIIGCRGYFPDTLHGSKTDTTADVIYAYLWQPLNSGWIVSGETTLDSVIIAPLRDTVFWLEVRTLNGCLWVDSVHIKVADSTPKADWTYITQLGCEEDTVRFINLTPTNVYVSDWLWDFDDTVNNNGNRITSSAISPTHIYKDQAIYSVLLTASNQYCLDTMRKYVNLLHPIVADFKFDDSTVCTHKLVTFTDLSTLPPVPIGQPGPTFYYTFGDGDTSHLASPTHTYTKAGNYQVMLAIMDYLGCADTVYKTIVVDTIPFVRFVMPDSIICEGSAITLIADYLKIGSTGITVDLGDGTVFQNSDTTIYSFAQAKSTPYEVVLTAHYRICPDTVAKFNVTVVPFPGVNIGPDTVLCPNGQPIVLADRVNIGNPAAKYLWNTGDTTASILAKDIGTFWTRVTIDGCSGTDSILVNKDCYIDIPNSFTPNGDGMNDYFLPRQFLSRSVNSFKMSIFNRWGQVIYESSTPNGRGWDGRFNDKDQPQGVYVYIIDVSFDNGVKEHYTGNVTLLR
jgi:gliding motility-associated-like protein